MKKKLFPQIIFLSFIMAFLLPLQAFGQDFPRGPITLYVGYEPGASTDITARALATEAERFLGVPIVPENKPGGASSVAAALLAGKKADGYTLAVIGSSALNTVHIMSNLSYDPFKDFTYIFSYGSYLAELTVRNDSPFKKLPDLIQYARDNPGKLSFASPGVGSSGHLSMEHVAKEAKVKFKHVPFKGGAPASTALLGGHVDFMGGSGSHLPYTRQGVMRTLAVTGHEKRDPKFPDVPRVEEFGYKSMPMGSYILLAPKGLPDPIFKKIEAAFSKSAHSPELHKFLDNIDHPIDFKDRRQFEEEFPGTYKLYADFLKERDLTK